MKYNLNNTPTGNLRVEFYNNDFGQGFKSDFFNFLGGFKNAENFMYKGKVSDCYIYTKQIKILATKHPGLMSVKIYKL